MQWTIYAHPLGPLGLTKSFSLLKLFFGKQPEVIHCLIKRPLGDLLQSGWVTGPK